MLKIRLMRIGTKGRPFYRIVVVDERKKRTGGYVDLIGTYNPLSNPKEIKIDQNKVDEWVKKGAQLSDGFLRITKQNVHIPERKVRNPGKLRSNTPVEEAPVEEANQSDSESADQEVTESVEAVGETPVEAASEAEAPTEETQTETPAEETPEVSEDAPAEGEAENAEETPAEGEEKKD